MGSDFNFAIVGGGLTATAMLVQFVGKVNEYASQKQLEPSKIGIQIFEKQNIFALRLKTYWGLIVIFPST